MIAAFVFASTLAQSSQPIRPPDGTYRYALSEGSKVDFTSTVVVRGNGTTFDVSERVTLPNGAVATTVTTYDSTTLLPLRYELQQGAIHVHGAVAPASVKFTLTNGAKTLKPLSYALLPDTKHMLVYDGLNAFRMILPYIIAAHPGESMTVGYVDAVHTERAYASTASPQRGGPSGDVVSAVNLDKEQLIVWRNPKTGAIDLERVAWGDAEMTLVGYSP
jgi:hypothetical protein